MGAFVRIALALAAPLLLVGCLTPGKFGSRLVLNADRSFTFSYTGEVHAVDPDRSSSTSETPSPAKRAEAETQNRAIADALSKEAGYRSVTYMGGGKFLIDYQISGELTHGFVFPVNLDAQAVIPFIAVELRANGTARVKAPGFANDSRGAIDMPGAPDPSSRLDGMFVLETDADLVSTNNEDGPAVERARKLLTWRVTPLTREAPMAVVAFE